MNLVWHIAKKDLRRIGIPLAVWLGSFAAVGMGVCFAPVAQDLWPWDDLSMGIGALGVISAAIIWVQWAAGGILAASIMHEDGSVGTTAWWKTRPVAGRRLLGAKLVNVSVWLVLAPVLVLLPVWAAAGFSAGAMLEAAWDIAKWQMCAVWLAIVVAAVAETLIQALFAAAGVGAVASLVILAGRNDAPAGWAVVVVAMSAIVGAITLAMAYLKRNICGARAAIAIGIATLVAGRAGVADRTRAGGRELTQIDYVISPELRNQLPESALRILEQRLRGMRFDRPLMVRPRIVAECPLHVGVEFSQGAARLKILGLIENNRRQSRHWFEMRIEERDAWRSWRDGAFRHDVSALPSQANDFLTRAFSTRLDPSGSRSFEDVYLIVLPSFGAAAILEESIRVTIARYSIVRTVAGPRCELPLKSERGQETLSILEHPDARLLKVRLEKRNADSTPQNAP